ncbi:MAG: S-layer homology domain-containing protein [Chloroflexota bacterium]|nr:S-layer homology domain-containing protein [Chloroflexota bacterium]
MLKSKFSFILIVLGLVFVLGAGITSVPLGAWGALTLAAASAQPLSQNNPTDCGAGTWTAKRLYPINIAGEALTSQNGILYSFGGASITGDAVTSAYKYDPATDRWTAISPLPEPRVEASAVSDGIYIYILNGYDTTSYHTHNTLYRYNPTTDNYVSLASSPLSTNLQTAVYLAGKIYRIAGSGEDNTQVSSVDAFNVSTGAWSLPGTVANYPVASWTSSIAYGGYIYSGGNDYFHGDPGLSKKTYRYDPTSNSWDDSAITDLPIGYDSRGIGGILNGRWILTGTNGSQPQSVIALDMSNPVGSWTSLSPMLAARNIAAGASDGHALYVVGGIEGNYEQQNNQQYIALPCVATTGITLMHPIYPTQGEAVIGANGTVDGNPVTIDVTVQNSGGVPTTNKIGFWDDETGQVLPDLTHQSDGHQTITVPPGQSGTAEYTWDSMGFAWNTNHTPHSQRRVGISLETATGQRLAYQTVAITVRPKPVIFVHGLKSFYSMWNDYEARLQSVNPLWRGFAPGDGYVPGGADMDMGDPDHPVTHLTKTITENSQILDAYIEAVRTRENAWRVDLVAHSMGGLVARKYIQSNMPSHPELDTRPTVTHLVMLGTPNEGTPCADLAVVAGLFAPFKPASFELSTFSMLLFNIIVTNSNGVAFSILAGTPYPWTCQYYGTGDGWVPQDSAEAPFIADHQEVNSDHSGLVTNPAYFTSFTLPRLASTAWQAAAPLQPHGSKSPALTPATLPSSPQVFLTVSPSVGPGSTLTVPLLVPVGSAFGVALAASPAIGITLRDPANNVVDQILPGSPRTGEPLDLLTATNPAPGTWTLTLNNTGPTAESVQGEAWIAGNPLEARLNLGTPTINGQVPLNVTVTNNGAPMLGATVSATVNDTTSIQAQLSLLDDGLHGDGQANDGVYGNTTAELNPGSYSVVAQTVAGSTTRLTSGGVLITGCTLQLSDVHPADYFYTAVQYLACHNIISGYSDGTFRPYNNTTRGQLSKIIVGGEGWAITTSGGPHFTDVPADSIFYGYIETAYAHGIISGYSDGTFRPSANVTRGQLSKIIVGAQGWPLVNPPTPHFADVLPGSIFYTVIETAVAHGIVSGYSDGSFRPGNPATRGQISKIVYLALSAVTPPSPTPTIIAPTATTSVGPTVPPTSVTPTATTVVVTPTATCTPTWHVVVGPDTSAEGSYWAGVAKIAANDIWMVGYSDGSPYQTLTEHWNGTTWTRIPSPNIGSGTNTLSAITAIASNDVWAVGSYDNNGSSQSLILHWTGTAWAIVPSPNIGAGRVYLASIAAAAATDVWIVGSYDTTSTTGISLIEHWNGISWAVVPSPSPGSAFSDLAAVAVVSATDVWAVGALSQPVAAERTFRAQRTHAAYGKQAPNTSEPALIEHWDGTIWQVVPGPDSSSEANWLTGITALASNNVWAVGVRDYRAGAITWHWNGTTWSVIPPPVAGVGAARLYGVSGISATDVWAVGVVYDQPVLRTLAAHWDGTGWTVVPTQNVSASWNELFGVVAISPSNVWAVGDHGEEGRFHTLIQQYAPTCPLK